MRSLIFFAILAGAVTGCSNPIDEAKQVDTIEAWEAYLAKPEATGSNKMAGEGRLETLMSAKAEADKSIPAYDALMKRFPKSRAMKDWSTQRIALALAAAEAENTPEGWQKFVAENPKAEGSMVKQAKNRIAIAEYSPKMVVSELKIEQVNLAEDPKGPKDGWGFSCDITNNGDKAISYLNIELRITDPSGAAVNPVTMPAVASTYKVPMPEEWFKPIEPTQTRRWEYTTNEVPENFASAPKATMQMITLKFVGEN